MLDTGTPNLYPTPVPLLFNASSTASARSLMVVWPWFQKLAAYQWQLPSGASQYTFVHTTSGSSPFSDGSGAGYGGGTLAMTINTADSPSAAIVWALVTSVNQTGCSAGRHCPGYLVAYKLDTSGSLTQIWPSSLPTTADLEPAPFGIPTVKNSKVYAPAYGLSDGSGGYTKSGVAVYGFCSGDGCL